MEQKSVSERLMATLNEISNVEVNEIALIISIIKRNINDLINKNMQILSDEFLEKCEYYGKSISQVNSEKIELLNSYKEEFNRIALKFEEEYMNLALELQEVQSNQKIAIANMKKVVDMKAKYLESEEYKNDSENSEVSIDVYNVKIDKLADKYIKYCGLEQACIVKLKECNSKIEKAINSVMQYEVINKIAVVEKKSIFKFFSKLLSKFTSEKRFQKEYIEKKKENIEKIKVSTDTVLSELDREINDSLIILDAYNSKINQVCS